VPPKATPPPTPPPAPPPHRFTRSKVVRVASIIDYNNPDPPAGAAAAGPRVTITVRHPGLLHGLQTFRRHLHGGSQAGVCSWYVGQRLRKTASGWVVGGKRVTKRHAAPGTFGWVPRRGAVMRVYLFNGRYFTRRNIQGHYGIGVSCRVRLRPARRAQAAAVNPWRAWFTARIRLRTHTEVEHACQVKARHFTITTRHPVICVNPDPRRYLVWNTGFRRGEVLGWYDVEWKAGPRDGLIYRYDALFRWRGGIARVFLLNTPHWNGPTQISHG
jgi:hypothetical protein